MHQDYSSHSCLSVTTVTAVYSIYGLKARCRYASLGDFNKINSYAEFVENTLFKS